MTAPAAPALPDELVRLVRVIAHDYNLPGAEYDDLVQHGLIGAWEAVLGYAPERGASLVSFAALCIRREMITALKTSTRHKHGVLNTALRTVVNEEGEIEAITDHLPAPAHANPLEAMLQRERLSEIKSALDRLSPLERAVTLRLAAGESYADMADLGSSKKIDNALQRARRLLGGGEILATVDAESERRLFVRRKGDVPRSRWAA